MNIDIAELQRWDERIQEIVASHGLHCYPQEFEICDHNEMIGYMAYSGMPSRYSHWSFGKAYERQKALYEYGVSGLPYEMVINSEPCLAYLMRDNSLLMQVLTMAHVYGHNDFFANNFTFTSGTDARHTLEMFKNHGQRVASYREDPSIGLEQVEETLEHAHAIQLQRSRNLAVTRLEPEAQRMRAWERAQIPEDPWREIHPKVEYKAPDLDKVPLEPDENLLLFIAAHNPYLPDWKRDLLHIVDEEARYFIPQMETKIMNEGWASYWHHTIINELQLPEGMHLEFLVKHNQVLCPHPGSLNPYHLGFVIWRDIERRWNEDENGQAKSKDERPAKMAPFKASDPNSRGRKKIFEVRKSDRDTAFLRRFLTIEIMRELDLFQHEQRGKERVVSKISDEESWEEIKRTLITNVGSGTIPTIAVEDADFGRNRTLQLRHHHDGRDLQLEYAEHTLKHIQALWGRDVILETELNHKAATVRLDGEKLRVEG